MDDAKYIFLTDCKEKKSIARSVTDEDNAMLGYGGQFIIKEGDDKYKNET